MSKNTTIRSSIISFFFGVFLILTSLILFVSFFSYSACDQTFRVTGCTEEVVNFLGFFGSHIAGLFFDIFYYSKYLVPLFLLIIGIKKIFGLSFFKILYFFIFFSIGLVLLNLFLVYFYGKTCSLTNDDQETKFLICFLQGLIDNNFSQLNNNNYVTWLYYFLIIFSSAIFLAYGLTLKLAVIFQIVKNVFFISLYPLKILKLKKFYNPGLKIKSFPKKIKNEDLININKIKKEPTIERGYNYPEQKNVVNKIDKKTNLNLNFNNEYSLPPLSLLKTTDEKKYNQKELDKKNIENSKKLETILKEYGVDGSIVSYKTGPVITLFEFIPAPGIKTSKIVGLSEDIARAMSSLSTRISSQPGKNAIGIEIPNDVRQDVFLGDLLKDQSFMDINKKLTLALGKNISGEKKYTDLERMPHLLIAGTTGSGKSVGINSMILSLLFKFRPSECKLILIDPKMLELSVYEDIPHLLSPVVTDPKKAVFALKWVVREMEDRYRLMSSTNVKNIQSFNEKINSTISRGRKLFREVQTGIDKETRKPIIEKKEIPLEEMPLIVVIIDEMADLMMVAGKEVESLVQRLAQMARASGIHLITATQRPSVDVITGTIKANFPSRISFRVASRFDSRTILNEMGAEQLLGSGDMLFLENGANIVRLHGGFVSENEIEKVVNYIKSQSANEIFKDITKDVDSDQVNELNFNANSSNVDELYDKAVTIVIEKQKVSTSFIQRYLQIGYNRAARIVEQMEEDGIISEANHMGKRNVLKEK